MAASNNDRMLSRPNTTVVPADYFDQLVTALDVTEPAAQLATAAKEARRRRRIQPGWGLRGPEH